VWLCPRKMRRLGLGDGAVQELNNIGQYIFSLTSSFIIIFWPEKYYTTVSVYMRIRPCLKATSSI